MGKWCVKLKNASTAQQPEWIPFHNWRRVEMHSNYFSKLWPHGDFPGGPVAKTPRSQSRRSRVQSLLRELGATCHGEMIYRSWLRTARARTENSHTINKDPERVRQRWKIRHGTAETQCSQIHKFISMLSIKKIIKKFCLHSKNILTGEGKKTLFTESKGNWEKQRKYLQGTSQIHG